MAVDKKENVVLMGANKVGKTALWSRLLGRDFPEKHHSSNLFVHEPLKIGRNFELWDTTSLELSAPYVGGTHQFLLVWSAANPETLNELGNCLNEIKLRGHITENTRVIFVRNKIDAVNMEPTSKEQKAIIAGFVQKYGIQDHRLVDTSAKDLNGLGDLRSRITQPLKSRSAFYCCAFFKNPATQAVGGLLIAGAGAGLVGGSKALAAWLFLQLLATATVPPIAVVALIVIGLTSVAAGGYIFLSRTCKVVK